ncbi:MAG TPA: hypothetical protein DCG75_10740 [Bacteroidales bacterium]|nr:hypothetical protein [Bacteroidales bacterium]
MDRDTFKNRLETAGKTAVDFARKFVWNKLSDNLIFVIQPNSLEISEYLNETEKQNLRERISELDEQLNLEEAIDRLFLNEKVPVWIDCSVIKSKKNHSVIQLLTSRRFRTDSELHHQSELYPPFHVNIQNPPYFDIDSKEKFEANWRYKKIQFAWNMYKAKRRLKRMLNEKYQKENYWNVFEDYCEKLDKAEQFELSNNLKEAKKYINGLTDGWHDYLEKIKQIKIDHESSLKPDDLITLNYLIKEVEKKINAR